MRARSVPVLLALALLIPACGDESTSGPPGPPPPGALLLLNDVNTIFRVSPAAPSLTQSVVVVTGLGGEILAKIKFHPASGQLLGLTETGRFFLIDPDTGDAGQLFNLTLAFTGTYSFDFHPTTGIVSVQTSADDRGFVDPTDGTLTAAPDLAPASTVVAAAYAPGGSLVGISMTGTGDLVAIDAASAVTAVGPILAMSVTADLDVHSNGVGWAVITPTGGGGVTNLYTIDVATGAATLVGPLQPASLRSLTVIP